MGDAVPGRLLAADLWLCRLVCSWRGSRSASVGDSKHPNPRPRPSQFTCSQLTAERAQQRCLSSTHRPQRARCCCHRHEEVGETDSQPRATVPDRSACAFFTSTTHDPIDGSSCAWRHAHRPDDAASLARVCPCRRLVEVMRPTRRGSLAQPRSDPSRKMRR